MKKDISLFLATSATILTMLGMASCVLEGLNTASPGPSSVVRQAPPERFAQASRPSSVSARTTKWGIPLAPCAWCGATNDIEVHHVYPQHLWPDRARATNNMVCLCRRCHLVLGHQGCWTNAVTNLLIMIEEGKK